MEIYMENLKRYDIYIDSSSGYLHTKAIEEGDWIKFSDYKEAVERSDNSAMIAIALLDEKLKFYNEPISAHDAIDEYNDIMKRWRSAKAS